MQNDLESVATAETLTLGASAELRTGMWAVLAAGALAVGSMIAELAEGRAGAFTLAHALSWAALVPLFFVVRAYRALARETQSWGLRASSECLFGVIVLLQLLELATLAVLPEWARVTTWSVLAIGLMTLLIFPFEDGCDEAPAPTSDGETATSRGGRGGWITSLAVALLLVLGRRMWRWLDRSELEAVVGSILLLLGVAFLLWLAVSKIRLRDRLGGVAALLGWAEILIIAILAGLVTRVIVVLLTAAGPVPIARVDTMLEEAGQTATVIGIAAAVVWTSLTARLFHVARKSGEESGGPAARTFIRRGATAGS